MKPFFPLSLLVVALGPARAAADEPAASPTPPAPAASSTPSAPASPASPTLPASPAAPGEAAVSLAAHLGVATAPFVTAAFPVVKGQSVNLVLAGHLPVTDRDRVGVRVPLSLASVAQPGGSYLDEAAWGNPELFAERRWSPWPEETPRLQLTGRLGVGLPLAERGPSGSLLASRALAVASATDGLRNPELSTPGVVPLTPAVGGSLAWARWTLGAMVKMPVLFRIDDAGYSDQARLHTIGLAPVIEAVAGVQVTGSFEVRVSADLVVDARSPVEPRRSLPAQLVLDPALVFRLSRRLTLAADLVAPLGGALGGATVGGGLRAQWAW